jgi:class 3 adenylate cyclase
MDFYMVLDQIIALLQQRGRVSYQALKRQFNLDDAYIDDLKVELIDAQQVARDDNGRVLVWAGEATASSGGDTVSAPTPPLLMPPLAPQRPDAERRQLTVMFCDLVGSTPLSKRLDPEDLREVVRAYQHTCAEVIQRFHGHVAQLLGDALLVYFGWPQAHEDSTQQAVHAGIGMIEAMHALNTRLEREYGIRLGIRVGMHTGLVVIGEMGGGEYREQLALGETPNIAARIQGFAEPDTVLLSVDTYRLVQGYFTVEDLGPQALKGVAVPMRVYRVLAQSGAQSRMDVATAVGLTPLVGRDSEIALLLERWAQVQEGRGQVVLLSGEAGIGKSRLLQALQGHIAQKSHTRLECRSSPYYQNSALHPLVDLLQRFLQGPSDGVSSGTLERLEELLAPCDLATAEVVPLFTTLLALPLPVDRYPPLALSAEQHRYKTLEALLAFVLARIFHKKAQTSCKSLIE